MRAAGANSKVKRRVKRISPKLGGSRSGLLRARMELRPHMKVSTAAKQRLLIRDMFNHMVEHRVAVLDRTFAALAHPTRRAIVRQLRGHDRTVSEIAAAHPMSLAAVAKHLDVLQRAGLLRRTRVCSA